MGPSQAHQAGTALLCLLSVLLLEREHPMDDASLGFHQVATDQLDPLIQVAAFADHTPHQVAHPAVLGRALPPLRLSLRFFLLYIASYE